ncbi:hypothetical protein [Eubacterium barkeri]|uniref:hypothetical protein n=1 Tax=Eubacterium barkeri TaxID=1528 RepID=UPI00115F8E6A|nr:hypothetical protein [Eubacterium barkeri]
MLASGLYGNPGFPDALSITHSMMFFDDGKDPFDGFIPILALRSQGDSGAAFSLMAAKVVLLWEFDDLDKIDLIIPHFFHTEDYAFKNDNRTGYDFLIPLVKVIRHYGGQVFTIAPGDIRPQETINQRCVPYTFEDDRFWGIGTAQKIFTYGKKSEDACNPHQRFVNRVVGYNDLPRRRK